MRRPYSTLRPVLLAAAILLWAGAAAAQGPQPLIVTRSSDFVITGSIGAGYDENVTAGFDRGVVDPRFQTSGSGFDSDLNAAFSVRRTRVDFGGSVGSSFRVYRTPDLWTAKSFNVATGVSANLTQKVRLTGSFYGDYSPQFQFSTFPVARQPELGRAPAPVLDYGLAVSDMISYGAVADLSYGIGRRSTVSVHSGIGSTQFDNAPNDLRTRDVGGSYSRGLTRYAALRLGYTYREGDMGLIVAPSDAARGAGAVNRIKTHNIDVGIDYSRALSFSRRAKFNFATGSAATSDGFTTWYHAVGNAALTYELSRTWNLGIAYNHGVQFVAGLANPLFGDALGVDVGGNVSRRVRLSGYGGYSNGEVGNSVSGNNFDSSVGRVRTDVLLNTVLSAYAEYFYFHYDFDGIVLLPADSAPGLNRHGVRAGLSLVLPIVSARRTGATR